MKQYFYTYGSHSEQPFNGGWTEVIAPDRQTADRLFVAVHPCRTAGILDCAWVYDEEAFAKTKMPKEGNFNAYCQEIIAVRRV